MPPKLHWFYLQKKPFNHIYMLQEQRTITPDGLSPTSVIKQLGGDVKLITDQFLDDAESVNLWQLLLRLIHTWIHSFKIIFRLQWETSRASEDADANIWSTEQLSELDLIKRFSVHDHCPVICWPQNENWSFWMSRVTLELLLSRCPAGFRFGSVVYGWNVLTRFPFVF